MRLSDLPSPAIRVENLGKTFGTYDVFKKVCFSVEEGEIVGLVGQNGAGKTTLLSSLGGLLEPNEGSIEILSKSVKCGTHVSGLCFVPDSPAYFPFLTAKQHLKMIALAIGLKRTEMDIEEALTGAGISHCANLQISAFSRGMLQRMAWAEAIFVKPRVIVLDEPTSALDPEGVDAMRKFIAQRAACGSAVLFSSHNLDEVERLCTRVLLLENHTLSWLKNTATGTSMQFEIRLRPGGPSNIAFDFVDDVERFANSVKVKMPAGTSIAALANMLSSRGIDFTGISELNGRLSVDTQRASK